MARPSSVAEALDQGYVIVEKGDTLSEIELKYIPKYYAGGDTLKSYNNIENKNLIYVGQKIYIKTKQPVSSNKNTSKAKIQHFGLQSKPDEGYSNRTLFATWVWDKSNTDNYKVVWEYDTGDGVWFEGSTSTVDRKQSIYDAPEYAKRVRFKVKPISKKRTINGKESSYWTAGWSTYDKANSNPYSFKDNPPSVPGKPTVTIESLKLTAKVDASDLGASLVQFCLWKDGKETSTKGKASPSKLDGSATYEFKVAAGSVYNVKCRSCRDDKYSAWSDPSDEKGTPPPTPSGFTKCVIQGDNHDEVLLEWKTCKTATGYTVECVNDRTHFDVTTGQTQDSVGDQTKLIWSQKLEEGKRYYFRVKAKNEHGESGWSTDSEANTNKIPAAPTTWSSSNSAVLGEPITLYWIHNSEDGNSETNARLRIFVNDIQQDFIEIAKSTDENEKDKTSKYEIPTTATYKVEIFDDIYVATNEILKTDLGKPITGDLVEGVVTDTGNDVYTTTDKDGNTIYFCIRSAFAEGAKIVWSVQTMGGEVNKTRGSSTEVTSYSEWSIERTIYIYAPPTVELSISNASGDEFDENVTALPIVVNGVPGESSNNNIQAPIGYYISITPNNSYITLDEFGNEKSVAKGEVIYSKYVEVVESNTEHVLDEKVSAGDVTFENNESYTLSVTMSMNSGLSVTETLEFEIGWGDSDDIYEPDAEIIIDEDDYSASIRPYCGDSEETLIEGVTLAVYRREYNGKFTEIASGLSNSSNTFVLDPHPSLDFARYRIVATYETTGSVVYTDIPGIPIACNAAIIQWDEEWSSFDVPVTEDGSLIDGSMTGQPRSGSMLKIPYNIDVTSKTKPDVEFVEYIGREHPVSYYGTHLGESLSWSMAIPKSDKETIYALRRLSVWRGDVYIRDPSGIGYWANVSLSFPQKHGDVTVPISIEVTRVEGGI